MNLSSGEHNALGEGTPQSGGMCQICGGAGFLRRDLPVDHPDFGKSVPCVCKQVETIRTSLLSMSRVSGLSSLGHMTFEKFRADFPGLTIAQSNNLKQALEVVWAYAARGTGWLVITGSYGSGKTHLAASVANERLGRSEPVLFVLVPDLLDHLRSAFSPSSEISYDERFEAVASTPFLILDDFGSHNATPWAQEKLFQIFDYRYNARFPTVITMTLNVEIDPRLKTRILDTRLCQVWEITAPSYRGRLDVQPTPNRARDNGRSRASAAGTAPHRRGLGVSGR